jgi:predicted CoA-binding protein
MFHPNDGNVRLASARRNRYTGSMRENLIDKEEDLARIVRDARTVAVVGMKDGSDEHAPAFAIPKALKARGLRVIPVNPMIQSSLGMTAYKDLASVPEAFDIVDVFRRSEKIPELVDEILALPSCGCRRESATTSPPRAWPKPASRWCRTTA